jgi:hypothetical protein
VRKAGDVSGLRNFSRLGERRQAETQQGTGLRGRGM